MVTDFCPVWLLPNLLRLRTKHDGVANLVNLPTQGYVLDSDQHTRMLLIDCIYDVSPGPLLLRHMAADVVAI